MPELTQRDIMLLFTMSLSIVIMSFLFPAFGIGGENVAESEIPTLEVSENRFDLAGDSPKFPNSPNKGSLWFNTTKDAAFSENSVWLTGDTSGGVELTLRQDSSTDNAELILTRWNGTVAEQDRAVLGTNNTRDVISVDSWNVAASVGDDNSPPGYLEVDWRVSEGSDSTGFLGSIFGAASDIASVMAWFVLIFIWFSTSVVGFFMNAVSIIFQASAYFISLLAWLSGTYAGVIAGAPGWAGVFVSLPGIILSATLGKMLIVFVGLLPTT